MTKELKNLHSISAKKQRVSYAFAMAEYYHLLAMRKTIFAKAYKKAKGSSITDEKEIAYASCEYIAHLNLIRDAREKFFLVKVEYDHMNTTQTKLINEGNGI